jgi:hypothetical protein
MPQPASLSGKMLVMSGAGRLLSTDAAVVEVDDMCVVQMVNRSPRRIWYIVFAYHRLILPNGQQVAQTRKGRDGHTSIKALSSFTKTFKHPFADFCILLFTLWSYKLTTPVVKDTLLGPGASWPILTSS